MDGEIVVIKDGSHGASLKTGGFTGPVMMWIPDRLLNTLRVFLPASVLLLWVGVVNADIDVYHDPFAVSLAILTALLILCVGLLVDLIIRRTHL